MNLEVWYSDMQLDATWTDFDDGTKQADYLATLLAESRFINWFPNQQTNVRLTQVAIDSATAEGDSYFDGIFPFFNCPLWKGHAFHRTAIYRAGNYQAWLSGDLQNFYLRIFQWQPWKAQNFETGGSYPHFSRRDHSWYVVDNILDAGRCI